jgi:hypothetical protein
MGPDEHIKKIFEELCDNWDRCKKAREGDMKNVSKSDAFQKVLYNCEEWKSDENGGINEVPSIFLDMGGDGDKQKLELTAWSYIVETKEELYKHHTKYLFGIIPVDVPEPTGKFKKVCVPSMGTTTYNTTENGLVWIMGHPLFYQFNIGYSLEDKAPNADHKGSMAFMKEKCGSCDQGTSLLSSQDLLQPADAHKRVRPTRSMDVPPRVSIIDTSIPL